MSGQLIKVYAQKLMSALNENLPADEQMSLQFPYGWIECFKKRYSLGFWRINGETLNADQDAVNKGRPKLACIISTFDQCDVWRADEFGLFYRQPPTSTLCTLLLCVGLVQDREELILFPRMLQHG